MVSLTLLAGFFTLGLFAGIGVSLVILFKVTAESFLRR
jgi:hypothetical protein